MDMMRPRAWRKLGETLAARYVLTTVGVESRWQVRLCGPLRVEHDGRRIDDALPGRQGRLLLAYLLLNRDRGCPRAELIDLLWPEQPPAAADTALSSLLSKLRRAVGPDVIVGRSELRLVAPGPVEVDVESAAAAAVRAATASQAGDWATAAACAEEALSVDLVGFLPGAQVRWAIEQRRELESVRLRARETQAEAALRLGHLNAAEHAIRAVITVAPFRESAHRLLMEIHEAAGNPAEALRAYDDLRLLLREELGTSPGASAMAVHARVLRGDPAPPPPRRTAAPPPPAAPPTYDWPAPLESALDRHALVGRGEELAVLTHCWNQAAAGQRRLVLLAGDAGIGKTRAAAELAQRAHGDGATVLYGRFDEQTLAPYQPLVELVRGWSGGAALDVLRDHLGVRAGELAMLLPELGPAAAPAPTAALYGADADAQRLRFFDAVAGLLALIAADAPLVVVLDDLHWADRPTLQLVRYLLRSPQPRRMLLLGTYRDAEVEASHPLHELLADVRRDGMLERVPLSGLEPAEVAELVRALGAEAPPEFVAALHSETEGNPFFIEEVVRHLAASGTVSLADAGVPEGVREVISRRLRRLGEDARAALQVAAVIGREFDFDLLEAVAPVEGDALVAALDAAVEAGVLRETGRVGHYAFGHALLQATLYDGLSALRRARLHGRVGEAVVARRAANLDPHLPALAHHFAQAAPAGQPERAIDFALAAARRADRLLAWEEAADHYRAALRTREQAGAPEDGVRAELLLALGESEDRAGAEEAARETFRAAAATARLLGDSGLLGRAALGYAGRWSVLGRVDDDCCRLLEEALVVLGEEDTPLRARLLARLALELYYGGDPERRLELSDQALTLARLTGDPHTLAVCLDARHYALWRPENVEERLEVAAELRRVAEATGDAELELEGAGWTVVDLLELGDVQGADIQIAAAGRLAEALQRPLWLWWTALFRCTRAQLDGRFDEAERRAGEALEIGQRGQGENAVNAFAQAMYNIRREQGRLAEVEPAVARFVDLYPALPAWRAARALLHLEVGRIEPAREEFEQIAGDGFDALPRDANWLIAVTLLAEVCAALGDGTRAAQLYVLLAPYASRNVVVGRAATCNGSASRLLGLLATATGEYDRAEAHFVEAFALHERMGARPWTVRTQLACAEMLLSRRRRGDRARARELLGAARATAGELGMVAVAARVAQLQDALPRGRAMAVRA
jgi:DNA-binding SARP family transcriptional activator/tetratricopeptide (TPR) repeat protein